MLGSGKATGIVLDVARQRGGAMPGVVTLHDHSRFGNDGAMTDVTWVQEASGLWVMEFTQVTSVVDCGTDLSLDNIRRMSVEAWIHANSVVNNNFVFSKAWGQPNSRWGVVLEGAVNQRAAFYCENSAGLLITGNTNYGDYVFAGAWFHLVGTWDNVNVRIYVNTVLGAGVGALTGVITNPAQSTLIRHSAGACDIRIALPRIYTYALSPAQIRAKFTATRRLFGV